MDIQVLGAWGELLGGISELIRVFNGIFIAVITRPSARD